MVEFSCCWNCAVFAVNGRKITRSRLWWVREEFCCVMNWAGENKLRISLWNKSSQISNSHTWARVTTTNKTLRELVACNKSKNGKIKFFSFQLFFPLFCSEFGNTKTEKRITELFFLPYYELSVRMSPLRVLWAPIFGRDWVAIQGNDEIFR